MKHWFTLVCCIITAVSAMLLYPFANAALWVVEARDWKPTACTILASEVEHCRGNSRWKVEYEYMSGGKMYRSDRYSFLNGYTSWDKEALAQLRGGQKATCYVDADDPAQSVVVRTMTWDMSFGLIPAFFFLLFGTAAVGGLADIRGKRRPRGTRVATTNTS